MPKSKEQKRKEAVERLERGKDHWTTERRAPECIERRHEEAARLREKFGIK
jgi:hypothetical protein